jgi:prephenate dehydratase
VSESIQAIANYRFTIVEEYAIKIAHALMISPKAEFDKVDTIMTHPQVLKQCKTNLAMKYERLKQTSGEGDLVDHAKVAELLARGELPLNIATMGSKALAQIYQLQIIEENLQDLHDNYTSFMWVERPSPGLLATPGHESA